MRVVVALMWLLHFLPLAALARIGRMLGSIAFWLIPERRRVTRINLAKCFPELNAHAREHLARERRGNTDESFRRLREIRGG